LSESQSIQTKCLRNDSNNEIVEGDDGDAATILPNRPALGALVADNLDLQMTRFQFTFEKDLHASRVYSRTQTYKEDVSFTSSAVRTHAWSVFSGLSLAEISVISAIALPLYPSDISNSYWYRFGELATQRPKATPIHGRSLPPITKYRARFMGLRHSYYPPDLPNSFMNPRPAPIHGRSLPPVGQDGAQF
jgi:hypothetical protein